MDTELQATQLALHADLIYTMYLHHAAHRIATSVSALAPSCIPCAVTIIPKVVGHVLLEDSGLMLTCLCMCSVNYTQQQHQLPGLQAALWYPGKACW